ncbi:BgTH12-00829 [Blumeria graminis f. sp. triticale]|nr:BgTH12-00829 [Blumeria graminis f. sp. triticale]
MPSIWALTRVFSSLSQIPLSSLSDIAPSLGPANDMTASLCPIDSPLSCHNTTAAPESCCFIYPNGQLLSTQFWDTDPVVGPLDSWTMHGLWPDYCDGSYPSYCGDMPHYANLSAILSTAAPELFDFMSTYWLPNRGTAENFWQREYNKHGTCINTLMPSCYGADYAPGDEVIDFFEKAVGLFRRLDTYQALAAAGITPSFVQTYTAAEIEKALTEVTGSSVVLGCWHGQLSQAWYSFNVKGSLQTGQFVPSRTVGKYWRGNCPVAGIKYLPKKLKKD